jgi:indolepyruvate ferredoxin oxidoreductase beta subunit
MLGVVLKNVKNFPFSVEEVKEAIKEINTKFAKANFEILDKALNYGTN